MKLNPRKKTGTGIKMLALNKLLTRLPVPLTQIKAGNNSCKLKNEIRQLLYLLHKPNEIPKRVYKNLIKSF